MPIVIKKRVSLEFLGEEYKDAYLVFKSIPAIDFEAVTEELKQFEDKQTGSVQFILDLLKKYFISGEFPDGELKPVQADDLDGLDAHALIECFKIFSGQELDPKVETPLTNTSPTEASLPENT